MRWDVVSEGERLYRVFNPKLGSVKRFHRNGQHLLLVRSLPPLSPLTLWFSFDVHPTGLEGALDRFAQFFIAPIFDPSCTEREANAVNSENSKNLQSDMWRMFQLDKSTSSREHSFWRFGTGNRETLYDAPMRNGVDVRGRLMDWHSKHYSANLMKLVVLSKGRSSILPFPPSRGIDSVLMKR